MEIQKQLIHINNKTLSDKINKKKERTGCSQMYNKSFVDSLYSRRKTM